MNNPTVRNAVLVGLLFLAGLVVLSFVNFLAFSPNTNNILRSTAIVITQQYEKESIPPKVMFKIEDLTKNCPGGVSPVCLQFIITVIGEGRTQWVDYYVFDVTLWNKDGKTTHCDGNTNCYRMTLSEVSKICADIQKAGSRTRWTVCKNASELVR